MQYRGNSTWLRLRLPLSLSPTVLFAFVSPSLLQHVLVLVFGLLPAIAPVLVLAVVVVAAASVGGAGVVVVFAYPEIVQVGEVHFE